MTSACRVLSAAVLVALGCGDDSDSSAAGADAGVDAAVGCQVYRDADRDGVGGEPMSAECDAAPPNGYVAEGGDCNDNDRYIHSRAAEPFDDGEDFDCDGEDEPSCALLNEHDPASPGLALDPSCMGADLYVAEVFRCYDEGCGDRYAFSVGNRGTVDLTDAIEVGFRTPEELTMARYVTLLTADIPSDGRSAPIRMPPFEPGTVLIELGADGTDCSIGNNLVEVEVAEVPCRE